MNFGPAFGNFHQVAWVTNDMDRSLALFRDTYQVPSFAVMDQDFAATVRGEKGRMKIRLALVNIDHVQLELIEPLGGIDAIYRDVLPRDGSYANVFHHVCVKVCGDLQDWTEYVAALGPARPVCYQGDVGEGVRFLYTDERPSVGMYVEHVWYSPDMDQMIRKLVPHYPSNRPGN
jgi:hypothetical protein